MPWTDKPGGSGNNGSGQGPWGQSQGGNGDENGGGRRRPGGSPDLEELLKSGRDRFRRAGRGGGGNGSGGGRPPEFKMPSGRVLGLGLIVIGVLYLFSGIYQIAPGERGVVTTFGAYSGLTNPGLNWHVPWPVQDVEIVKVDEDRSQSIGESQGSQTSMLTSDLNIVDVEMTVNYKVRSDALIEANELPNAAKFVFNIENPEKLVRAAAEAALRQVVGESDFGDLITIGRPEAASKTNEILQDILDSYDSGIEVIRVNLGSADPPVAVKPAQADVIDARSDQERLKNEATRYANGIVPRAEGEARQIVLEAQAYAQRVVLEARGAASRFEDIYEEYVQAPEVTRQRMYLETMEKVLGNMNKVLIDDEAGGTLPYLNVNELAREAQRNRPNQNNNNSGGSQ